MPHQRTPLCRLRFALLAVCVLSASSGCSSIVGYRGWPFPEHDRTSFHTPSMRLDAIRQFAARADGTDSTQQQDYVNQLARQIQIEPDPLVREAIVRATGEFRTTLSYQIIEAGLKDDNPQVRIASCQALGARADARAVPGLAAVLRDDEDKDVRLAAVEALGTIKDPTAVAALAIALDDRDPAMQYVGVKSMKSITGKNYGGDVAAWRLVAAGESPPEPSAPSIAERIRSAARF